MTKIAVIRRNGLGDLLCAFPLLLFLQKKYPDAELTLFIDERNAPLIPFLPPISEVVIFPNKGNKYFNLLKTAFRYRPHRFDIAISAKTSPMKLMNFFLFTIGAKKRIAYVDGSWHRLLVNTPLFCDPMRKLHQALKGLHTVAPEFKSVPEELYPRLYVPESLKKQYMISFQTKYPRVLISASTTREASRFDASRYAQLINRLGQVEVVVIGQEQDRARSAEIAKHLAVPHSLHFPRNFDAFMVLLDLCELYFIGDGGIAHIGAALGKKEVVLYGETDPREWSPLGKGVVTLYDPLHVNNLSDECIFESLKRKREEVISGREDLRDRL